MKRISLLSVFFILFIACQTQRYLPNALDEKIDFGMGLDDFIALKGNKVKLEDSGVDFRAVYIENIENSAIESVVYYFDQDGDKPLYEVILIYKDFEQLNKESTALLGVPNYKKEEWKISLEKQPDILAWKYNTKLIIVSLIPNTEWYEEFNP